MSSREKTFGVPFNVEADDPASAGWGIVFPSEGSADAQSALQALIEHRQAQLGAAKVKVLFHQPNETWADWLRRHGVGPGTIDPAKVPYYLLLVGPPTQITFEMQYLLDVEYAVGRLDLDDADAYRRYAATVVEYETSGGAARESSAAFFGTRHPRDPATALSADMLVGPLAKAFAAGGRFADAIPNLRVDTSIGSGSTKEALDRGLPGNRPDGQAGPVLLGDARHGRLEAGRSGPGSQAGSAPLPGLDGRGVGRARALLRGIRPPRRRAGPRAGRVLLRLLRRRYAPGRSVCPQAGPTAAGRRIPAVRRRAAEGPPVASAGRRAGGGRAHRPSVGILVSVDDEPAAAQPLSERDRLDPPRQADRVCHEGLQREVRGSLRRIERNARERRVGDGGAGREVGHRVVAAQRRPELRGPRRPGRPPEGRRIGLRRVVSQPLTSTPPCLMLGLKAPCRSPLLESRRCSHSHASSSSRNWSPVCPSVA